MFVRIINLFSGFLSSVIRIFESRNPTALIEAEKSKLRQQVIRFNQGLSEQAGVVYNLANKTQITSGNIKEIEQRISVLLEVGDRNNAARLALKLSKMQKTLVEFQTRFRCAEEAYQILEKSRDQAVAEAKARLVRLENIVSQTEILNAQNELAEIAGTITRSIGCVQNSLDHAEEIIEKNLQISSGRSHLFGKRLKEYQQNYELAESEKEILEKRALAEYLAGRGMKSDNKVNTDSTVALIKSGNKTVA